MAMTTDVLTVPDISCAHCEHAIARALGPLQGVESVRVDIPQHLVTVVYDEQRIDLERIKGVLAEEDYPVAVDTYKEER